MRPAANSGYTLFQRVQATPTVQRTWRSTAGGATSSFYRLLHRDHLGSVDVVSDSAGAVLAKTSFDPFGGRCAGTWGSDITTTELNTLLAVDFEDANSPRGYTDHEQLNRTGFVHMNGRVYDPRIGRFVSADPIVQAPGFSQSYNRYAYVFNNPVSLADPSGFEGTSPTCDEIAWCSIHFEELFESIRGQIIALDTQLATDIIETAYREVLQGRARELADEISTRGYFVNKGEADWLYQINSDSDLEVRLDAARLTATATGDWVEDPNGGLRTSAYIGPITSSDYAVHGRATLRLRPDGTYGIYDQPYDFELHDDFSIEGIARNVGVIVGRPPAGFPNTQYWIRYRGNVKVTNPYRGDPP